jgi:hypothetical protein
MTFCRKACPCRNPREGALSDTDITVLTHVAAICRNKVEAVVLAVLEKVSRLVTPARLAHLLSFPIQWFLAPRDGGNGGTLLYHCTFKGQGDVVEWLLDHGVCVHSGTVVGLDAVWSSQTPRCQPLHSVPWSVPWHAHTCMDAVHTACCKRIRHALLQAGAFPAPSFPASSGFVVGPPREVLERQWHAWHGRGARRLWLSLLSV